jgi:hypothetical protein
MSKKNHLKTELAKLDYHIELVKDVFDCLAQVEHRPRNVMLRALDSAANNLSVKYWPDENSPTDAIWHLRGLVCHLLRLHFIGSRNYAKDEPAVTQNIELLLSLLIEEKRIARAILKRNY